MVLFEEVNETQVDVRTQECTDLHLVIREVWMDENLIETLHGRLVWIRMACRSGL